MAERYDRTDTQRNRDTDGENQIHRISEISLLITVCESHNSVPKIVREDVHLLNSTKIDFLMYGKVANKMIMRLSQFADTDMENATESSMFASVASTSNDAAMNSPTGTSGNV